MSTYMVFFPSLLFWGGIVGFGAGLLAALLKTEGLRVSVAVAALGIVSAVSGLAISAAPVAQLEAAAECENSLACSIKQELANN